MRIRLLFRQETADELPTLVNAVDEYTEDVWRGLPDDYVAAKQPGDRELFVNVPDSAVDALFATPTVTVSVETEETK